MQAQVKECLPLAPAAPHILLALAAEVNRLERVVHEARFRLQALEGGRA